MLHVDTRCPLDPNAVDAWQPGDLNKMFERVAYEPEYKQYQPVVVSKPPEGPWMIMLENAISDGEAEKMIQLGGQLGYERSADVGKRKEDGTYTDKVNSGRTSTNAWCMKDCTEDPVAQRVMERIENITGIPETNSENLQLLRYEHEQFYQTHSDYIPYQADRPTGVRILTFYMYLNDVEEGGGTNFPHLKNLTVTPKRGRAVMWPSVHNDRPNKKDRRTEHQALPVIRGVKYGANAWVHQRDYKNPNRNGC
jgi:prolyl 4-hydroxylase